MKFTIKRSDAAEAVKKCMSVAGRGRNLPILSCIRIDAIGSEVVMTASDLDRWVICRVPAEIKEGGAACLTGRLLSGIFSSGESASVEVNSKLKATIDCGGSITKMAALAADEMPEVPTTKMVDSVTMSAAAWADSFRAVEWAASNEESRAAICGVMLSQDGDSVRFVATDGRRLCMTSRESMGAIDGEVIIPTATVKGIISISANGGDMAIATADGMISASCGGDEIVSKLIESNYPNYKAVIPDYTKATTTKVQMPVKAFVDKIDRLGVIKTKDEDSVAIEVSPGVVAMSIKSKDGDSKTSIEAMVEGASVTAAFRSEFLAQPFRKWDASEIEMEILDGMSPMVLTSGETICVIMPMRVQ